MAVIAPHHGDIIFVLRRGDLLPYMIIHVSPSDYHPPPLGDEDPGVSRQPGAVAAGGDRGPEASGRV